MYDPRKITLRAVLFLNPDQLLFIYIFCLFYNYQYIIILTENHNVKKRRKKREVTANEKTNKQTNSNSAISSVKKANCTWVNVFFKLLNVLGTWIQQVLKKINDPVSRLYFEYHDIKSIPGKRPLSAWQTNISKRRDRLSKKMNLGCLIWGISRNVQGIATCKGRRHCYKPWVTNS